MDSLNEISNKSFKKYILVLAGIGIVLFSSIYFGKQYKEWQLIEKNTAFYNQFKDYEYLSFAQELEASIINKQPEFFDSKVNTKSFLSFSDKELSGSFYKRKVSEYLEPRLKFGSIIVDQIDLNGNFRLTRYYKAAGIPHLIFRVYDGDMIYFIDFTVGIKDNELVLNDSYYYFGGITMSKNISKLYYKVVELDQQYMLNLKTYEKIKYYHQNQDHDRAYEVLTAIPDKYHDKVYYQHLLTTATYQDIEKFQTIIHKMIAVMPNDEKLHAYLYFLESIYAGNMESLDTRIEALEQHVGKDPIFDFYRGILYLDTERSEEAILYFDKTIEEMPHFFDAYFSKLYTLLTLGKTENALQVIVAMKANFYLSEKDLTVDLKEFESFVNSRSYKNLFTDEE